MTKGETRYIPPEERMERIHTLHRRVRELERDLERSDEERYDEREMRREVQRDFERVLARSSDLEAAIEDHRRGILSTGELYAVVDGRKVFA